MDNIRVVIADDHVLVRTGIETLLNSEPGFTVIQSCGSSDEVVAAVAAEQPDVVLTDIRMPPTRTDEGIQLARTLGGSHPSLGVVVLSQYVEAGYASALFEQGARSRGYLLKEHVDDPTYLFSALRAVASGGSYIDPTVVDAMFTAQRIERSSPLMRLTARELDVLTELASGKSNAAIARTLIVGERAVEKHINNLFMKLDLVGGDDVNRRVAAVLLFLEHVRT